MRLSWILALCLIVGVTIAEIKNENVARSIDISTHVTRIITNILADVKNEAYEYVVEKECSKNLAYIEAFLDKNNKKLTVTKGQHNSHGLTFKIQVPSGENKFTVKTVFTDLLIARPPEIKQEEKQYMKYTGNLFFFSPYKTGSQTTNVKLPRGEVLTYTQDKTAVKQTNLLKYGPLKDKEAYSYEDLDVHVEHNQPFLKAQSLLRTIEVSHWGNIAVEDSIELHHVGAKLIGPFSRFELRRGVGIQSAVQYFKSLLPSSAKYIYYRDEIGNVSTSDVHQRYDSVELDLRPRFPLFGGWKTKYMVGYSVPAHEYLYRKGDRFGLKMRLMDHIYDNQHVQEMTVKIVLPETISDVQFIKPYPLDSETREVIKTYLDTTGRIVVVLKASNLVEEHIQDFVLYYRFNMVNMLREPFMVMVAFILVFVVAIVYVRLDFTIQKDEGNEVRLRTQMLVEQVQGVHEECLRNYQLMDEAVSSYKKYKDVGQFNATYNAVETEQLALLKQLSGFQKKLAVCYNEGSEKMNDIQLHDERYRRLTHDHKDLVTRLIDEKISRDQFQKASDDITNKKKEVLAKTKQIVDSL